MRILLALLLIVLLSLQYQFWVGSGGFYDAVEYQTRVEDQIVQNKVLDERNQSLKAEVVDLKQGTEAIEERGRADLGLVKPDETFFQVIEYPQR